MVVMEWGYLDIEMGIRDYFIAPVTFFSGVFSGVACASSKVRCKVRCMLIGQNKFGRGTLNSPCGPYFITIRGTITIP